MYQRGDFSGKPSLSYRGKHRFEHDLDVVFMDDSGVFSRNDLCDNLGNIDNSRGHLRYDLIAWFSLNLSSVYYLLSNNI